MALEAVRWLGRTYSVVWHRDVLYGGSSAMLTTRTTTTPPYLAQIVCFDMRDSSSECTAQSRRVCSRFRGAARPEAASFVRHTAP
jgi:hypothetical protein